VNPAEIAAPNFTDWHLWNGSKKLLGRYDGIVDARQPAPEPFLESR
jgi:hypothetical protein